MALTSHDPTDPRDHRDGNDPRGEADGTSTRRGGRRRRLSLTGSLFVGYVLLLLLALATTGGLWIAHHDREVDRQYTERVLAIARSVAALPEVPAALAAGAADAAPGSAIDRTAGRVARATGAEYVVIATPDGTRLSHVNDALVGRRVSTPPGPAARGEEWSGVQTGTQGRSVRAKTPVPDPSGDGSTLGYVSVGILLSDVDTDAASALPSIVGTVATVLVLGAAGAYVLSRRVRAKTHGLEPVDITTLLESREALLHAVREGVLAVDDEDRIALVNPPARAMLGLPADCAGRTMDELGLDARVRDVVSGADPGEDRIVLAGSRILVCNRMPVRLRGRAQGAVVTLRDRTELDRLTGELDGARTVTRGLRAQSHEYANRIHTVAGLLELGAHAEARAYLADLSAAHAQASGEIAGQIADPAVAALALAKSAQAQEQGAELRLSPLTLLPEPLPGGLRSDVLLVVGNLVDNALESLAADGPGGWVELLLRAYEGDGTPSAGGPDHDLIEIRVIDSGAGVAASLAEEIFDDGFTTKAARSSGTRGLGLALVRQVCESRGGAVGVQAPDAEDGEEGAVFTAHLPVRAPGETGAPGATVAPGEAVGLEETAAPAETVVSNAHREVSRL